jgi:hypothetical protein
MRDLRPAIYLRRSTSTSLLGLPAAGPDEPPIFVQTFAESEAGWIGDYNTPWCCSDTNLFFFPTVADMDSGAGPFYMGNSDYMVFAMNNQGEAVGA